MDLSLATPLATPKGKLKAITTRSGLVFYEPSVPMPPPFINPKEDEHVEETFTDPEHGEFTIKVPPPLVHKAKQRNFVIHQKEILVHPNIPYPSRMNQEKQKEKNEVQIHKFWQMFKQLHINISLADALILIPKYQKMLKSLLSNKEKLIELANTPVSENCSAVILKKLPEKLGDPGKIFHSCVLEIREDLFATNHSSGNPTSLVSSHTNLTSPKVNDDIFDPEEDIIENLLNLDKTKDLPPYHDNQSRHSNPSSLLLPFHNSLSGSTTSSSPSLHISKTSDYSLEEFADELAHITFPPRNDDLPFDAKSDLLELEYMLNHDPIKDMDSILEDSVDENSLDDNLDDTISEMFTDEHALCDSVFYEDFSKVDALPSTDNEDKVFNPGILIHENLFEVTNLATHGKREVPPKILESPRRFFLALTNRTPSLMEVSCSPFSIPLDKLKYGGLGQAK
ncbi:hypothetical protein Tco_0087649 [Tanacetum coccineum]